MRESARAHALDTGMHNFTPIPSALGGILIGIAASVLLVGSGRVAGISGILGGILVPTKGDRLWRWLFVLGHDPVIEQFDRDRTLIEELQR